MYRINILEQDGHFEIELEEKPSASGRDHHIVHTEELDDLLAAKKRYHMLRTFDDDMIRSIVSSASAAKPEVESALDTILGRKLKKNVTMHVKP
ncbi:MAG: hypothetical protein IKD81_01080 [Eubacteriaceae bacterium]|nr:hypothetical protein [Eubacteriaceae bacterium]